MQRSESLRGGGRGVDLRFFLWVWKSEVEFFQTSQNLLGAIGTHLKGSKFYTYNSDVCPIVGQMDRWECPGKLSLFWKLATDIIKIWTTHNRQWPSILNYIKIGATHKELSTCVSPHNKNGGKTPLPLFWSGLK